MEERTVKDCAVLKGVVGQVRIHIANGWIRDNARTPYTEFCKNIPAKFGESPSKCYDVQPKIALWHNISESNSQNMAGMFLHYSVQHCIAEMGRVSFIKSCNPEPLLPCTRKCATVLAAGKHEIIAVSSLPLPSTFFVRGPKAPLRASAICELRCDHHSPHRFGLELCWFLKIRNRELWFFPPVCEMRSYKLEKLFFFRFLLYSRNCLVRKALQITLFPDLLMNRLVTASKWHIGPQKVLHIKWFYVPSACISSRSYCIPFPVLVPDKLFETAEESELQFLGFGIVTALLL